MSLKMPVKFHGSYRVVIRQGGHEKQEICQKLSLTPIAGRETPAAYLITYFSFGCRRVLEASLVEDLEERAVFEAEGRRIEFSPSAKSC